MKIGWQISIRFCSRLCYKYELIITNDLAQFVVTEPRKNVGKNGIIYRLSTVWVLVHAGTVDKQRRHEGVIQD